MNMYLLAVLYLACWRVSNLVANEPGPFHVFRRMRLFALFTCIGPSDETRRTIGNKLCRAFHLYQALQCEYCNSVYICTVAAAWYVWFLHLSWMLVPVLALAGSTAVIMVKVTHEKLQR